MGISDAIFFYLGRAGTKGEVIKYIRIIYIFFILDQFYYNILQSP